MRLPSYLYSIPLCGALQPLAGRSLTGLPCTVLPLTQMRARRYSGSDASGATMVVVRSQTEPGQPGHIRRASAFRAAASVYCQGWGIAPAFALSLSYEVDSACHAPWLVRLRKQLPDG
jgi:hypothetical protein